MKRIILYILPVVLMAASCKKWLDVKPVSEVAAEQLFTSQQGYEVALNGIYTRMSLGDAYGRELTWGFPDVLAQNWEVSPNADYLNYLQTSLYNYKDANFIAKKDGAWGALYNAIANDNLLLSYLDSSAKILTQSEYTLIKGEALALRAYMHFDLLRLFAPSYAANPNAKGIPYVTDFSNKVTAASTVTQVLNLAIKDLIQAKGLLAQVDPILSASYVVGYPGDTASKETNNPSLFLQNRRQRMNYYAVVGELARIYLYMGDKANALASSTEVINAKKFPWTKKTDFTNSDPQKKDRILYPELLFDLNIPVMADTAVTYFGPNASGLFITPDMETSIYEINGDGALDIRYQQWFNTTTNVYLVKYTRDPNVNIHPLVAPMLRLSEMYYIAAEASYDTDPNSALNYVDSVRSNRGVPVLTATNESDFMTALVKEARKEFYGEGQLFYMYKRLNRGIVGPSGIVNPPVSTIFVLPLPDNEIEFGGQ